MKSMKWLKIFLIVALLLCISIVGFSADKTLNIMSTQTDILQKEAQNKIAREFESKHPGVQVSIEYMPWKDVYAKVITGYKAGTLPEVATPDPTPLMTFAAKGLILPLDDVIEEIGKEDFLPQGLQQCEYQGHYYAVPYRLQSTALYYRKDLLKEKSLNPPTNWDEWLEVSKALTEDTNGDGVIDRWGCALPYGRTGWTDTHLYYMMWQLGGAMFDENNNVVFNSPEVREAMEFFKKMFPYSPKGCETYSYYDSISAFTTGKAAMTVYYGRIIGTLVHDAPELKDKVGAVLIPIPKGGKRVYSIGAGMFTVFKDSKYPDLGKEFIKDFMNSKYFADFCNATPLHAIPSRKSTAESEEFKKNEIIKAYPDILKVLQESIKYSVPEARGPDGVLNVHVAEIRDSHVFEDAIQRIVLYNEPIEDAFKQVEDKMKKILKAVE